MKTGSKKPVFDSMVEDIAEEAEQALPEAEENVETTAEPEKPEEAPRGVGGQYVSIGGGKRRKA